MADYGCSGNNKMRGPAVRRHQRSRRHKWPHTHLQVSDVQRRVVLEELGWLLGVKRFLDRGVVERIKKLQLVQQLDHALLPLRLERHVRHGRGQAQLRLQHRRAPPSAVATCNDHAVHVAAPAVRATCSPCGRARAIFGRMGNRLARGRATEPLPTGTTVCISISLRPWRIQASVSCT